MKICTMCGISKDFVYFSNMLTGKYGLNPRCKSCCKRTLDEWKSKRKEESRNMLQRDNVSGKTLEKVIIREYDKWEKSYDRDGFRRTEVVNRLIKRLELMKS